MRHSETSEWTRRKVVFATIMIFAFLAICVYIAA